MTGDPFEEVEQTEQWAPEPLYSDEAEMSILGSMMLSRPAAADGYDALTEQDFYRPAHQVIFRAMQTIYRRGGEIDIVTLVDALGPALKDVGGEDYVIQIAGYVPSPANSAYYAGIVKDKSGRRHGIELLNRAAQKLADPNERASEIIGAAVRDLSGSADVPVRLYGTEELMAGVLQQLDEALAGKTVPGLKTGFYGLDRKLNPAAPGELWVICGRPGQGKTSNVLSFGLSWALAREPGVIFSQEMQKQAIAKRLINMRSEKVVPSKAYRDAETAEAFYQVISGAASDLYGLPLWVSDRPGITVDEIRYVLRNLLKKSPLKWFAVDFLQIMGGGERAENQQRRIAERVVALKDIASEFGVTAIILSQLNRGVEARTDKRPTMTDLADSGAIEAAADVILGLYREDYYKPKDEKPVVEFAEIICLKQRDGEMNFTAVVGFEPTRSRFVNLDRESTDRYRETLKGKV